MDATVRRMGDDTNEWEEETWHEPYPAQTGRLLQSVISFALVAAVAFAAGLAIGGRTSGTPRDGSSVATTPRATAGDDRGGSCAGLPGEAWRTQLCPSSRAGADDGEGAEAKPETIGPACASLPDPAWKEQLCPSPYPGGRAKPDR